MGIKTLLETEIKDELKELGELEVGSDQHMKAVDGLTKLLDRSIEYDKMSDERREKNENREIDIEFRTQQLIDERKDRTIKNVLTGVSIVTGIGLTVWGTLKSFEFEKEGTVTTVMGRGFLNKLIPKDLRK